MTIRTSQRPIALPALTAIAALLLGGCMVGPDFVKPEPPKVAAVSSTPLPAATAAAPIKGGEAQRFVDGGVLPAQWWKTFGSATLDGWIDEAIANSPTLVEAQATLRQQQALAEAQLGALYPSVVASAGARRQKTSSSGFGSTVTTGGGTTGGTDGDGTGTGGGTTTGSTGVVGASGSIFNLYDASVTVSYAFDLWGGTQRAIEGARALVEATRYQSSAAYLTLVGNVVTSAVSVASAQARLKTAIEIEKSYQDTVRLAQRQFDLGASARADVIAVQTAQAAAQGDIPPLEQELNAAKNRLAVLIGRYPSEFDSGGFDLQALTLPKDIPVALPSALVAQRPDIAAASAQLQVASAEVGIAAANQLPQLVLSASGGTQASKVKNLFDETIWSIAGNLTAPLFDGGTLSARKRAAVAGYEAAQASYRNTVLNAFGEVADALSALETDARSLAARQSAFELAVKSAELTEARYRTGTGTIFEVRDARLTAAGAQQNLVLSLATRYRDTAALFQALGGDGWNRTEPAPAAAATSAPAAP